MTGQQVRLRESFVQNPFREPRVITELVSAPGTCLP